MELALGNYLTLKTQAGIVRLRRQNFFIGESVTYQNSTYEFMPFGFSGITVNRNGDNTEASLVLPNNEISRNWAYEALQERWIGTIQVMLLNPTTQEVTTLLHQYTGQIDNGEWNEGSVQLRLNTVLDAVGEDVPRRRLNQQLVGAIPISSNVRLQ
jgi:phage-related protein